MTDSQISGNTVTWNMHCQTPDGLITAKGELRYQTEAFDGEVIMQMPAVTEALPMTTKLNGHYTSPCTQ